MNRVMAYSQKSCRSFGKRICESIIKGSSRGWMGQRRVHDEADGEPGYVYEQ
jgi:hypothetical protein